MIYVLGNGNDDIHIPVLVGGLGGGGEERLGGGEGEGEGDFRILLSFSPFLCFRRCSYLKKKKKR